MIYVLIADSQLLTREGVTSVLSGITDIALCGQVKERTELERITLSYKPDVLIIDHLHTGEIKKISKYHDPARVLILSNKKQKSEIQEAIDLGIKNYITKDCSNQELIHAIYAAAKGKQYFCENALQILFGNKITGRRIEDKPVLSARETELIRLVAEGLTNKEISEKLFLSIHTVKTHRKNIIKKLGFSFKNAAELAFYTGKLT